MTCEAVSPNGRHRQRVELHCLLPPGLISVQWGSLVSHVSCVSCNRATHRFAQSNSNIDKVVRKAPMSPINASAHITSKRPPSFLRHLPNPLFPLPSR